jgi:hypothetical protein
MNTARRLLLEAVLIPSVEVNMLHTTGDDLKAYFYRHAEDCARQAASQSDARYRQDFLELERQWLSLASDPGMTEKSDDACDNHSAEDTDQLSRG